MFVIGTSGHVDHGKSTLVHALTGTNPDRLPEEREREMTIDLGFAWMTLPSGREVSIVDVPGHEDFVKNMLAGIGGVDVAILVVAADESVMPQTREHLSIIDLIQVPRGVVALTKADLVTDPEWLTLVTDEVRHAIEGTVLAGARIIPVSAHTGVGLDALCAELDRLLDGAQSRPDLGRPRLPIDRVFSMPGFGTVVTGTLSDGWLRQGGEVVVLPGEVKARIRGLQSHRSHVAATEPGSRVAVNLAGVDMEDVHRGQVVCAPGGYAATVLLDARIRMLESLPHPLDHNDSVEAFAGTTRAQAHVRLLDAEALGAGDEGWAQLRFDDPVVVARGDRFVMRLASPGQTIGGGVVVHAHPARRYRRFDAAVLGQLQALAQGDPRDVLTHGLLGTIKPLGEWLADSGLPSGEAAEAAASLARSGQVLVLAGGWPADPLASPMMVTTRADWEGLMAVGAGELAAYHARYPLRAGMPREELRARLRLEAAQVDSVLVQAVLEGRLLADAATVREPGFRVNLNGSQGAQVAALLRDLGDGTGAGPSSSEAEARLGSELFEHLVEAGRLVRAGEGVLFTREAYGEMEARLVAHLRVRGRVTVAEVRDLFASSRKLVLALVEETDRRHITRRVGDVRVLR